MKRDNLMPHPIPHPKVTFSAGPGNLGSRISVPRSIFQKNNNTIILQFPSEGSVEGVASPGCGK